MTRPTLAPSDGVFALGESEELVVNILMIRVMVLLGKVGNSKCNGVEEGVSRRKIYVLVKRERRKLPAFRILIEHRAETSTYCRVTILETSNEPKFFFCYMRLERPKSKRKAKPKNTKDQQKSQLPSFWDVIN